MILETVQTEKDMIRIAGEYYPAGFVKGKLLKLNYSHKEFILSVKHTAVSSLPLGSDPLGNIARINNLLESYPKKLADAEQKLETVKRTAGKCKTGSGKAISKREGAESDDGTSVRVKCTLKYGRARKFRRALRTAESRAFTIN